MNKTNKREIKRAAAGLGYRRGYGYAGDTRNRAVAWVGGFRRQPAIFNAFVRRRGRRPAYPEEVWQARSLMACPHEIFKLQTGSFNLSFVCVLRYMILYD